MIKRMGVVLVATALSVMLSACLLSPGSFSSALDLRKDGQFSFTYKGEIYLLALSKLAEMGAADKKVFEPAPCSDDNGEERTCTAAEVADQKQEWQTERKAAADKAKKEAEQAKAMLGGIDLSDPKAAEEFATRLRRQAGFRAVTYKGDGLYDVDFALSGRLDHDFVFPTIERFAMANAFVQLSRRNDGSVRIDAPAFASGSAGSAFAPLMAMSGAMGGKDAGGKDAGGKDAETSGGDGKESAPKFPVPNGTFTITTNGSILSNNTDEGPKADPQGQRLSWLVNQTSPAAPMALIQLGR